MHSLLCMNLSESFISFNRVSILLISYLLVFKVLLISIVSCLIFIFVISHHTKIFSYSLILSVQVGHRFSNDSLKHVFVSFVRSFSRYQDH